MCRENGVHFLPSDDRGVNIASTQHIGQLPGSTRRELHVDHHAQPPTPGALARCRGRDTRDRAVLHARGRTLCGIFEVHGRHRRRKRAGTGKPPEERYVARTVSFQSKSPAHRKRYRAFLLPDTGEIDDNEAYEMTRHLEELAPPRAREGLALVRAGREGTYWQAKDGLIVRVAARERDRDAETAQRELLELACRDAAGQ